jgi:nucleoside-diphosphate-sugar epimerase
VVGETINIGSGYATPLTELARVIEYRVDNCPGYRIDDCRTGEPTKIAADITKAKAVINYEPKHDLEEGLTRTINWYRDRPELLTSLC